MGPDAHRDHSAVASSEDPAIPVSPGAGSEQAEPARHVEPPSDTDAGDRTQQAEQDETSRVASLAVTSFLRSKETSSLREAHERARAERRKAIEEEAIASWLRARHSS